LIHRDLKPENVMVGDYGEVLVMDWGLALDVSAIFGRTPVEERAPAAIGQSVTAGTPSYMAPEMALGDGGRLGPWSDVYLLGAILHEILTGNPPHSGQSVMDCLVNAAQAKEPRLHERVPEELQKLVKKALAPLPQDRHGHAKAFLEDLETYLSHRESVELSLKAFMKLGVLRQRGAKLTQEDGYPGYASVISSFEQALELWDGNQRAAQGLEEARFGYARLALECGDLGLAETQIHLLASLQLSTGYQSRTTKLQDEIHRKRAQVRGRVRTLRIAGLAGVFFTLTASYFVIDYIRKTLTSEAGEVLQAQSSQYQKELEQAQETWSKRAREYDSELEHLGQRYTEQQRTLADLKAVAGLGLLESAKNSVTNGQHFRAQILAAQALGYRGYGAPPDDAAFGRLNPVLVAGGDAEAARRMLKNAPRHRPLGHVRLRADQARLAPDAVFACAVTGEGSRVTLLDELAAQVRSARETPFQVAFMPDGARSLFGPYWEVKLGLNAPGAPAGHSDQGKLAVCWRPEPGKGGLLVFGRPDQPLEWQAVQWPVASPPPFHLNDQRQVLALAGDKGNVILQPLRQGLLPGGTSEPPHHGSQVLALSMSLDGTRLATWGVDRDIRVWNLTATQPPVVFNAGQPGRLLFSPDGKTVISYGEKLDRIRFWDVEQRQLSHELQTGPDVAAAAITRDGRLFAYGWNKGPLEVWDLASRKRLASFPTEGLGVRELHWLDDAPIVSGLLDGGVVVWWQVED
jgi:tetratricopeptide (TPR) repeat protein